jgi:hypothetical protein
VSHFLSFGSSSPTNANDTYEELGFGTDGSCVTVTASGTTNTKGNYSTLGTTANDWAGFWLEVGDVTAASTRYIVDIRAASTTIIMPDLFMEPGLANGRIWIPLAVASGTLLDARCQSNTASATIKLAVSGRIRNASHPAMYSSATALNVDTGGTRATASGTAVSLASSLGSYTQLISSTAATYGALLMCACESATPATSQQGTIIVAKGGAGSETQIGKAIARLSASGALLGRCYKMFEQSIPSGTRLAAAALAPTPGTDSVRVGLYGFS